MSACELSLVRILFTVVGVRAIPPFRQDRRRAKDVSGTAFTVVAQNNSDQNVYVQSAELNGKPLTRSWFTHSDIVAGGELRFHMGREPNKA